MTPAALVQSLRHRGVRLEAEGSRLHYVGTLTPGEVAQLRQHKAEVLRLLTGKGSTPAAGEAPMPLGPCGLCHSPLAWVEDWPSVGEARWLCASCATWPAKSLSEVFAMLTDAERGRLDTEAVGADPLVNTVMAELG